MCRISSYTLCAQAPTDVRNALPQTGYALTQHVPAHPEPQPTIRTTQQETIGMKNPATDPICAFTVLLERRAIPQRGLAALLCALLVAAGLLAVRPAFGQTAQGKIAPDLQAVIAAPTTPNLSWAHDV